MIELSVQEVAQLFESLDPYPFREKDLDKDAEEFIVGWARELPGEHALRIVIHLPHAQSQSLAALETAGGMSRFFAHRAAAVSRDLRELFRVGRMSLAIGVSVLVACVVAAQYAETVIGSAPLGRIVQESLVIMGWVANWRPLEIFLYDWWPLVRRRNLYRRLAAAKVELKPLATAAI
ncbi:MAG: hypothetical protein K8S25_11985 [Alphaproteobacteria bacterium]|nr:hypothetical protein [Alphaproteobacteria bacterium]